MDKTPVNSHPPASAYAYDLLREVPSPLVETTRQLEDGSRSPLNLFRKIGASACSKAIKLKDGVTEIVSGVGHDFIKSPKSMVNTSLAGLAVTATQYTDRVREPFVQASRHATEHLATGSPYFGDGFNNATQAGLIAGGVLAGSYFLIGEGMRWAVNSFPTATQAVIDRFPRAYNVAKYSTAGIISSSNANKGQESSVRHALKGFKDLVSADEKYGIKKRSLLAISQGATVSKNTLVKAKDVTLSGLNYGSQGLSMGTVAQAAVSTIEGWSRRESRKLIAKTSLAMGALTVPIVIGVDAGVDALIRNQKYTEAERLVDLVSNRWFWLAAAGGIVALNYRKNTKIARGELDIK